MTWYRAGSVTAIQGVVTVTGESTMWNSRAKSGEALLGPDGKLYEIATINSDTQLTLTTPYGGPSVSGSQYVIVPTQSYMRALAGQVTELITLYSELPDSAYEAGQSATDAATSAQQATEAKDTAVESKEQAVQKASEAQASATSASTSANTATAGAATASTKASEAVVSQVAAAASQMIAETARDAAIALSNLRTSLASALADAGIAVGATFTFPLADGSLQAARKDSSSSATLIGAPFASSQAVTSAATAAAGTSAYLGYVETSSVKGSTSPNTTTITSGFTYGCGVPTPSLGRVPTFYIRSSASGTGEIHFYTPNGSGGYDTAEILSVTVVSGENTIPLTSSARYWPAGTVIHYNRLTGGWPRYDAGGLGSVVSSTAQVKGSPLVGTLNPSYGNTIAIAYEFVGSPNATVASRLGLIETGATEKQKNLAAAAGVTGDTVSITAYGDTSPNSTTITAGFTYGCKYAAPASGFLESFSVRLSAAGTGQVIVYEEDAGGNYKVAAAFNVTAITGPESVSPDARLVALVCFVAPCPVNLIA